MLFVHDSCRYLGLVWRKLAVEGHFVVFLFDSLFGLSLADNEQTSLLWHSRKIPKWSVGYRVVSLQRLSQIVFPCF